jgi:hypothetical protein
LNLNVFLRVPQLLNKKQSRPAPLITLQHNLLILRRATASTEGFHFLRQPAKILLFAVYAIYNCHWPAKFSCLHPNSDALLFLANFTASTNLSRKPACRTNIRHCTQKYKHTEPYIKLSTTEKKENLKPTKPHSKQHDSKRAENDEKHSMLTIAI